MHTPRTACATVRRGADREAIEPTRTAATSTVLQRALARLVHFHSAELVGSRFEFFERRDEMGHTMPLRPTLPLDCTWRTWVSCLSILRIGYFTAAWTVTYTVCSTLTLRAASPRQSRLLES